MKLQSPLGVARGLGSAKSGVQHWWSQRLTATALVPLSLWLSYNLGFAINTINYYTMLTWLSQPFNAMLMLLFIGSLYYHASLGLQVVIEDYIHSEWQRIGCLILLKFMTWIAGLTAAVSVLKIYFTHYGL